MKYEIEKTGSTSGIKDVVIKMKRICEHCEYETKQNYNYCPICGEPLKRSKI